MSKFTIARRNMVDGQLRPNRVADPAVLHAFASVPRERFVPKSAQSYAYIDEDLPLGEGRYLEEPIVLARLLQAAEITGDETVLCIGCATGYAIAVCGSIAATVVGVDANPEFVEQAKRNLLELDIDNGICFTGEHQLGRAEQAPYDVILIHGSVFDIPAVITGQLAEGGRLVTVRRDDEGVGRAILMKKFGHSLSSRILFDANCPVLPGFDRKTAFSF